MSKQLHFFVRATALIFLWRGVWHLTDIFLFPSNAILSNVGSLIIGGVLIVIADTLLWPDEPRKPARPQAREECAPQE